MNKPVRVVGVLGAGQMGSGIASALIGAAIVTRLLDRDQEPLQAGAARAVKLAARPGSDATDPGSLLTATTDPEDLSGCELVIEAVTENENVKAAMYRRLASVLDESALVASNTSTIPITRLARSWPHPRRFAGMHFFHPVHRMRLIEIIKAERTGSETIAALVALARRLDKVPVVVSDGPGFLTTRLLYPYLSQALQMIEEGFSIDAIDEAALAFGMPTGPVALMDYIGLDTVLAISRVMTAAFPDRMISSSLLEQVVGQGRLGRKAGTGFRDQEAARSRPILDESDGQERATITDRLLLAMLVEAMRAIDDGIVDDPADVDTALRLGMGFPASKGGILAWLRSEGVDSIRGRLNQLAGRGPAFQAPAGRII